MPMVSLSGYPSNRIGHTNHTLRMVSRYQANAIAATTPVSTRMPVPKKNGFHATAYNVPAARTARGLDPCARIVASTIHRPSSNITVLVMPSATPSSPGIQCAIHDMPDRFVNGSYRQVTCSSSTGVPR